MAPEQLRELAALYKSSFYEPLLDLMERSCIQIESCLIDAPIGNPEEILGAHAVTKAAWLFFHHVQKQVYSAYQQHTQPADEAERPRIEEDVIQSMEGLPMGGPAGDMGL